MENLQLVSLTEEEMEMLDGGRNWWMVGAGVAVGIGCVAVSCFAPEASPWIGRIGYRVSSSLIVNGLHNTTRAY